MQCAGGMSARRGSGAAAATTTAAAATTTPELPASARLAAAAQRRRRRRSSRPPSATPSSSFSSSSSSRTHETSSSSSSSSSRTHETVLIDLHDQLVPYEAAWAWQKRYVDEMCAAKVAALARQPAAPSPSEQPSGGPTTSVLPPSPCRDALVLLQHPPVYTLGAGATRDHLRFDPDDPPLPLHRVERGGEVTYHGPGQLVLYPLLDLGRGCCEGGSDEEVGAGGAAAAKGGGGGATETTTAAAPPQSPSWQPRSRDLHWYLRSLEEVAIRALWRASGLRGKRVEGLTGVWVDGAKLAAVGVRARSWCTYHGLALNVGADLSPFRQIVPCGISDRPVGSVRSALGLPPPPPPLPALGGGEARAAGGAGGLSAASEAAAEAMAAAAAARDPLVAEYRAALLEAFEEVFDARLTTGPVSAAGMIMAGGGGAWEEQAAMVATPRREATAAAARVAA